MTTVDPFSIGISINEVPSQNLNIVAVDTDALCVFGAFSWGPVNKWKEFFTFKDFTDVYGTAPDPNSEAWLQVYVFFTLYPGRRCVAVRLAHYTDIADYTTLSAIKASGNFDDSEASPGTTITDNPLTIGATVINLTTATGFPAGGVTGPDYVLIESEKIFYTAVSGNQLTGVTRGVLGSTAAAHLTGVAIQYVEPFGAIISAKYEGQKGNDVGVEVLQTNKITTTTTSDLPTGATSVDLVQVGGIQIGEVLKIGANGYGMVKNIVNNTVYFYQPTQNPAPILTGANVVSLNNTINVYVNTKLTETWTDISPWMQNVKEFAETVINNNSQWIYYKVDIAHLPANFWDMWLAAVGPTLLTGGSDGGTILDVDAIGSPASKTGLYALDSYRLPVVITQPDFTTAAVQLASQNYAEKAKIHDFVSDMPYGLTVAGVKNYVDQVAAFNSSFNKAYWPNIFIQHPINNQPILIHTSGSVVGRWAQVDTASNGGPWIAAAGLINGTLNGVLGMEQTLINGILQNATDDNDVITSLQRSRINSVLKHPTAGYVLWGARTMDRNPNDNDRFEFTNQRGLFRLVEASFKLAFDVILFQNNNQFVRAGVSQTALTFLGNLAAKGAFPNSSTQDNYKVLCNDDNNPPEVVKRGILNMTVTLAKSTPINQIAMNFSGQVATS